MELDALKAKQRTQQAQGAVGLLRGMAQAARGAQGAETAALADRPGPGEQMESNPEQKEVRADAAAPLLAPSVPRCRWLGQV
jgi:hypothetical protein